MLASTPSTPRPIPPAKMRRTRTPSLPIQPPPPYAPRMDIILDSPIPVTAQLVDRSPAESQGEQSLPAAVEEWMNEKSREELSNLLFAAGDIIKSRETELGLTSVLCKNLFEENYSLKNKHDALLARIPGQDPSPRNSPVVASPALPTDSPHYYSASRPISPAPVTSPARPRHNRRISVTPDELSLLADQNAELLDKLEKLEEESAHADLAGKKKLKKLEKEISGLREELEKTREKGEQLEENMKKRGIGLSPEEEDELRRKREEREERLKALRASSASNEAGLSEVKDFAPAPELPRLRKLSSSASAPALNLATKPSSISIIPEEGSQSGSSSATLAERSSYFPPSASSSVSSVDFPQSAPRLEYAIISQLLSKIRELEETNAQIAQEQKATAERLQAAQRQSESIRRAYDCLSDEELQIITEEQEEGEDPQSPIQRNRIPTGSTIRFSSLRKTIEGDVSSLVFSDSPGDEFASGIAKQSTTRSTIGFGSSQPQAKSAGKKVRKSVAGLFDADAPPREAEVNKKSLYPATLSVSPAFRALSPIPIAAGLADMSTWSVAATDGLDNSLDSPTSSPSPSVYSSPLPSLNASTLNLLAETPAIGAGSNRLHSLGSELGSEFGDDWGDRANSHLRTASLFDLSAAWHRDALAGEGHGRDSPAVGPEIILPTPSSSPDSDICWEDVDESPSVPTSTTSVIDLGTPTKIRKHTNVNGLQLVIEPPTPATSKTVRNSPSSASLRGVGGSTAIRESRSSRNLRLSQTVKARTNRWVERAERRYADTQFHSEEDMLAASQPMMRRRRSTVSLQKQQRRTSSAIDETFDEVVHQFSRSISGSSFDVHRLAEDEESEAEGAILAKKAANVVQDNALTGYNLTKRDGFVGFILEVWLWLQFIIVVGVFLWAMARRGPKSVLEDAERRRVEMQRGSRR